jgi:hypothetical protein
MPTLRGPRKKTPSTSTDASDKHVQFSENIQVIPATEELSEKDRKDCFQQEQDFENIVEEVMLTARKYQLSQRKSGVPFDEEIYTIRGIEHVSTPALMLLQRREKAKLTQVVWDERQRRKTKDPNIEKFKEVCQKITGPAIERALALAQDDEREAKEVARTKGGAAKKRSSKRGIFKTIRRLTGTRKE